MKGLFGEPVYHPPYDSPLEDLFAYHVVKYLTADAEVQPQVEVHTICGAFRLDFVVTRDNRRAAFECDGREYHDEWRDEWRDAMILGTGAVEVIYRLRGSDLFFHLEDSLFLVSKFDPVLFSERGLKNLEALASDEARSCMFFRGGTRALVEYRIQLRGLDSMFVLVERRPREKVEFWKRFFDYAASVGGGGLDEVMASYEQERSQRTGRWRSQGRSSNAKREG